MATHRSRERTDTHACGARPLESFPADRAWTDLGLEAERLMDEDAYRRLGRNQMTLLDDPAMHAVLIVLRTGAEIAGQRADGRATLQVLAGTVRACVRGSSRKMSPGEILALDPGVPHDVAALADAALLFTSAARAG